METSAGLPQLLQKVLLSCGILSALVFAGTDIVAGLMRAGYRFDSQSASLLSAFGSPTRRFVLPLNIAADLFLIAFAVGAWLSADNPWMMRVTAGLLAGNALFSLSAVAFFPMHPDEPIKSSANSMNVILMAISVVLFVLAICFGAAANRNWFRYFSIGIIVIFAGGILAALAIKPAAGGQSGSMVGAQERTMMYLELLWLALQAGVLLGA